MRDFDRGNNRSRGGRDFNNRGSDRPAMMHKTICSNCGKECEVPFKPTGSRPVFCSDCFRSQGGPEGRRSEKRDFVRPQFETRVDDRSRNIEKPQYKEQFDALNTKLDKILAILIPLVPVEEVEEVAQPEVPTVAPEKKKRVSKKTPPVTTK